MKPDSPKAPPQKGAGSTAKSAVVLLSGGLDSATAAAWAANAGYRLSALSIDYGQRHRCELEAARGVARAAGIDRTRVLFMPQGRGPEELARTTEWLRPECQARGIHLAHRFHIEWFGHTRGT